MTDKEKYVIDKEELNSLIERWEDAAEYADDIGKLQEADGIGCCADELEALLEEKEEHECYIVVLMNDNETHVGHAYMDDTVASQNARDQVERQGYEEFVLLERELVVNKNE